MCARALLEHGVSHLAIIDVDSKQGTAAVEHLHSINAQHEYSVGFWNVDVTREETVNEQIDMISRKYGGIDILLCFAGITDCQLALDYDISDWRRIFDVNIHGTFLVARAVAKSGLPRPIHFSQSN